MITGLSLWAPSQSAATLICRTRSLRTAHRALQETIIEFTFVQSREHPYVGRRVHKPDEPGERLADAAAQIASRYRACPSLLAFGHVEHDPREPVDIQMEADTDIWSIRRRANQLVGIGQPKE